MNVGANRLVSCRQVVSRVLSLPVAAGKPAHVAGQLWRSTSRVACHGPLWRVPRTTLQHNARKQHARKFSSAQRNSAAVPLTFAIPAGLVAGGIGAICGVGGGVVLMPVLRQFTSLPMHAITSTSLLAVTVGAVASASVYLYQGVADPTIAAVLAVSSMPFTALGVAANNKLSSSALTKVLGVLLLCAAPAIAMKSLRGSPSEPVSNVAGDAPPQPVPSAPSPAWPGWSTLLHDNAVYFAAGAVAGCVSGLVRSCRLHWDCARSRGSLIVPRHSCVQVGLGGGIITTTLLATTTSMDQHRVVATSIVALAATGLAASVQNFRKGNVQVRSAVALGLACAAGMAGTAAWIAPRVDESSMKLVFSGLLGLSALRMLVA